MNQDNENNAPPANAAAAHDPDLVEEGNGDLIRIEVPVYEPAGEEYYDRQNAERNVGPERGQFGVRGRGRGRGIQRGMGRGRGNGGRFEEEREPIPRGFGRARGGGLGERVARPQVRRAEPMGNNPPNRNGGGEGGGGNAPPPPPPPQGGGGGGPGGNGGGAGVGGIPRAPRLVTVRSNFERFVVDISDNEETAKALKELGVAHTVRVGPVGAAGRNPHAVCAAVRTRAIAEALSECGDRVVVDYYSSARTGGIVSNLNTRAWDKIRLVQYFPQVVSGDLSRGTNSRYPSTAIWETIVGYQDVLVVDVYADARMNTAWTREVVANIIPTAGQRLYWIGWCFQDPMGVGFGESSYLRRGEEVYFMPDGVTSGYQPHNICSWMWNDSAPIEVGGNFINWTIKRNWNNYYVIKFENKGIVPLMQIPPILPRTFIEVKVEEEPEGVINNFAWKCARYVCGDTVADSFWTRTSVNLFVHVEVWNNLRSFQVQGNYSQLSFAQLERQVAAELNKNAEWKILVRRYPVELKEYQSKLVALLAVYAIKSRVNEMEFITSYNPLFNSYNEMRASIGKKQDSGLDNRYTLVVALLGATGVLLLQPAVKGLMRGLSHKLKSFWSVLTSPLTRAHMVSLGWETTKRVSREYFPIPWISNREVRIWGPIMEEVLKTAIYYYVKFLAAKLGVEVPWWLGFFTFGVVELVSNLHIASKERPLMMVDLLRIVPLIWHTISGRYNLLRRIVYHMIANGTPAGMIPAFTTMFMDTYRPNPFVSYPLALVYLIVLEAQYQAVGEYRAFRDNFYVQPWNERRTWVINPGVSKFDSNLSVTPTQDESFFESKVENKEFDVSWNLLVPGWAPKTSVYYWLIPTNIHGYVPSRSDANMEAIVKARIIADPPMDAETQAERWEKLPALYEEEILEEKQIIRDQHVLEWLEHMEKSKQKKYKKYIMEYEVCTPGDIKRALKNSKLQIKTDELLIKGENGGLSLKPRAIINVNPLVQVMIGPEIYKATERLKKIWDLENPFVSGEITTAFGSAGTDLTLTHWLAYSFSQPLKWHIIVAGDDMIALNHAKKVYLEGDASMFDQSQARGPLIKEHKLLERLGVTKETIELSLAASKSNYVGYSGDKTGRLIVSVNKKGEANRASGHCDTTVGNSIVMAIATRVAISKYEEEGRPLEESYAHLGLKMKFQYHDTAFDMTFLKGMWYPTEGPYPFYWGPLPSRVLKVGKSLKDPRSIYGTKDFHQAASWFLGDVAKGYSAFIPVPVLRAFVEKHRGNAFGKGLTELDPKLKYKINAANVEKPHKLDFSHFYKRYQTTEGELLDLESIYPDSPFNFVQHPLLDKLVLDYQ